MINFSAWVEARITAITVSGEGKSVAITLWRESTGFATLKGLGVERLLVNEFREQNIVHRVLPGYDAVGRLTQVTNALGYSTQPNTTAATRSSRSPMLWARTF